MAKQQEVEKKTVLVAVDGSEHSERAFDWYTNNFYRKGDEILVFHSHEVPSMPSAPYPYGFDFSEGWKEHLEQSEKKARDLLESYYKKCQEKNLKCRLIKETGNPGEAVCKVSKERKVDHVVMGSRGLGTVSRALVGSVSDYCLHHASVPVSVVPPPDRFDHHGFMNKQ
ncbi:universal stress protein Slr1101-like [Montipora capricornis]|uniref:universal stress protein Slr1101-like n=1 Tax=Montipora foliosa TaxID=591990 RepID=UPI0035F138F8